MEDIMQTLGVYEEKPNVDKKKSMENDNVLINHKAEKWIKIFVKVLFYVWVVAVIISGLAMISNSRSRDIGANVVAFIIGVPILIIIGYVVKCFYDMFVNISITLREINKKLKASESE